MVVEPHPLGDPPNQGGSTPLFARVKGGLGRAGVKAFGLGRNMKRGAGEMHHASKAAQKHREASLRRREGGDGADVQSSSAAGTAGSANSDHAESPGTSLRCSIACLGTLYETLVCVGKRWRAVTRHTHARMSFPKERVEVYVLYAMIGM